MQDIEPDPPRARKATRKLEGFKSREQQKLGGVESNRLILCHMVALRANKPEKNAGLFCVKRLGWTFKPCASTQRLQ